MTVSMNTSEAARPIAQASVASGGSVSSAVGWSVASWPPTVAVMIATMKIHERWSRISIPNRRAIGTPFTRPASDPGCATGCAGAALVPGRAGGRAPGPTTGDERDEQRDRDDHDPDHHRGLGPELEREQLDEPVGRAGRRVYVPPAKNSRWNTSNAASNAKNTITPPTTTPTIVPSAPARTARHQRSGWPSRRAPA